MAKDTMRQAWEDEEATHEAQIRKLLPQYTDADELAKAAFKVCEPDKYPQGEWAIVIVPRNYLLYALYCVHNRRHIMAGGK
jgi:hypothetical protein